MNKINLAELSAEEKAILIASLRIFASHLHEDYMKYTTMNMTNAADALREQGKLVEGLLAEVEPLADLVT